MESGLMETKKWIKACSQPHVQWSETVLDSNYHMFIRKKVAGTLSTPAHNW